MAAKVVLRVLTAVAGLTVLLASPAAAGGLVLDPPTVPAGGTVVLRGTGCVGGAQVEVRFDSELVQDAEADASGAFTSPFVVPAATTPGTHQLSALCGLADGTSATFTAEVRVVQGVLAATGPVALPWVVVGTALVAAGVVLARLGRRAGLLGKLTP